MRSGFSHSLPFFGRRVAPAIAVTFVAHVLALHAADVQPFRTDAMGTPSANAPVVKPWRVITVDPLYGGNWVVAGDIDGNGEVEIVSAQNFNEGDNHFTGRCPATRWERAVALG